MLFHESGNGKQPGPLFGSGDVVGCGLNVQKHEVFWTRNGAPVTSFAFEEERKRGYLPPMKLAPPLVLVKLAPLKMAFFFKVFLRF